MKYTRGHKSRDLADHRGSTGRRRSGGLGGLGGLGGRSSGGLPSGGGMPLGKGCGGGGIGTMILIALLFFAFRACTGGAGGGFDLATDDGMGSLGGQTEAESADEAFDIDSPIAGQDPDAELTDFMGFLIDDVNDFWQVELANAEIDYVRPTMNVFNDFMESGCGGADARMGPHYCTLDNEIYLDFDFFATLAGPQFNAGGDFAQAYVVAHEVGHHLQNQLGISQRVRELSGQNRGDQNELSIRLELQADCLAGVWAHSADQRGMLEPGDVEEGLTAAASVGDDRIQSQAGGAINPEGWTHGSAEDRQEWFYRGLDSGDTNQCDTFSVGGRFSDG